MKLSTELITSNFLSMSARLGNDPLQVQGPGGNTSIKDEKIMWIKASGTELANAETESIFVAVDRIAANAQANGYGDGTCIDTVIDPEINLRPSIETTFHAALNHKVVVHTHSISTLTHVISNEGRDVAKNKLKDMPFIMVPYAKPGVPLTNEILARVNSDTKIILLQNHGLICCGETVEEVSNLIKEVETRLYLPPKNISHTPPNKIIDKAFSWTSESWMAQDKIVKSYITSGSFYPDHVVFLGSGLPVCDANGKTPVVLHEDEGVAIRSDATNSQKAMLKCLSDIMCRLPKSWIPQTIGVNAEAELLNWDAEKYRQKLAVEK